VVPDVGVVGDGFVQDEEIARTMATEGTDDIGSREDVVGALLLQRVQCIALLDPFADEVEHSSVKCRSEGREEGRGGDVVVDLFERDRNVCLCSNEARVGVHRHALLQRVAIDVEDFGGRGGSSIMRDPGRSWSLDSSSYA
jgi:hypothetical protein